jgi:heavy metal sensor kinase
VNAARSTAPTPGASAGRLTVRATLALWFGMGLVVVVAAYAVAVFVQMRVDLYEALDGELDGDLAVAEQCLTQPPAAANSDPGPRRRSSSSLPWAEAWTLDGRRVFVAPGTPALPPPTGAPPTPRRKAHTIWLSGQQAVRVRTVEIRSDGRPVVIRVARSEDEVRHELGEFATSLGLSLPVAFILAAGAGYWLAGLALAPVAAMTARARRINAENLSDRLPVRNEDDEFGQLASVVNEGLARLEQSFSTLRQFTADASHELRTPLTAIRSVGEVGLRERRTESEYREIIGSILEDTGRLSVLVDSLLMLSRADAGRIELTPTRFDLHELADDVADDLRVLAEEKEQALTVEGPSGAWVRADRETMRRAVINLVDNAVKFGPHGSSVAVVVADADGACRIDVRDQGPGIDAVHLPRVFDRFYRVDEGRSRAAGGSGLGLAIARWAVEVNGGALTVDSTVGSGSTFRITLPASR